MIRSLVLEREQQKQRVEQENQRAQDLQKRTDELYLENLRLQLELERYKKWYYGPRADRLATSGEVAQHCWSSRKNWIENRSTPRMVRRRPSPSMSCGASSAAQGDDISSTSKIFRLRPGSTNSVSRNE